MNPCSNCKTSTNITINSYHYCSEECYNAIIKKCEFCAKGFNRLKQGVYNEPYYFCTEKHMKLANPRICFGVIGGPVGGPLGKPSTIIEPNVPIKYHPFYIAPAPPKPSSPPPGLQKAAPSKPSTPPPGLQKAATPKPLTPPPGLQRAPQPSTPIHQRVYQPSLPIRQGVAGPYMIPFFPYMLPRIY